MSIGAGLRKACAQVARLVAVVLGLINLMGMVADSQRAQDSPPTDPRRRRPLTDRIARPQQKLEPSLRYRGVNKQGHKEYLAADGSVLIHIPAGSFVGTLPPYPTTRQGSKAGRIALEGYYIGKFEVTNAQFTRFAEDVGFAPAVPNWQIYRDKASPRHPVVYASWRAATAYCEWAGLRLPTVMEWERAARGTDGRTYPWGQEWDPDLSNNFALSDPDLRSRQADFSAGRGPLPTGAIPGGASPCGALDMVGNVAEWCADEGDRGSSNYEPHDFGDWNWRMLCGGSWDNFPDRCTLSPPVSVKSPEYGGTYAWGFRVALSE